MEIEKLTLTELTEEEYELMKSHDSNKDLQEDKFGEENAK